MGFFGALAAAVKVAQKKAKDDWIANKAKNLTNNEKLSCCMKKPTPFGIGTQTATSDVNISPSVVTLLPTFDGNIVTTFNLGDPAVVASLCGTTWDNGNNTCDDVAQDFCKVMGDDPRCTCLSNPPLPTDPPQLQALKANPLCYSRDCLTNGWQPTGLRGRPCPSITICKQKFGTDGNNNIATENVSVQNCGGGAVIPPTTTTPPSGGTGGSTTTPPSGGTGGGGGSGSTVTTPDGRDITTDANGNVVITQPTLFDEAKKNWEIIVIVVLVLALAISYSGGEASPSQTQYQTQNQTQYQTQNQTQYPPQQPQQMYPPQY